MFGCWSWTIIIVSTFRYLKKSKACFTWMNIMQSSNFEQFASVYIVSIVLQSQLDFMQSWSWLMMILVMIILATQLTPLKTNRTMEKQPFEDIWRCISHSTCCGFSIAMLVFKGVIHRLAGTAAGWPGCWGTALLCGTSSADFGRCVGDGWWRWRWRGRDLVYIQAGRLGHGEDLD